jgi:bifunctional DNA-binding transcriptional regulator/antitoxin component of YhaV-PrlF toxin-antitoxin module
MTYNTTIESQDTQIMGFTANTVGSSQKEFIDVAELKFRTDVFIKDLVTKASNFHDLSKRTDNYLYELLQDCYETFLVISKPSSNIATVACDALDKYCTKNNIAGKKGTKLLSKFMNSVFQGADRSKISTYSYVIKYAIKNNVATGALAEEIKRMGGIQKIKEASFADVVAKSKAKVESNFQKAQTIVDHTTLDIVEIPNAIGAFSHLNTGDQVLLIATINEERKFVIRAATSEERMIKLAIVAATKPQDAPTEANDIEAEALCEITTAEEAEFETA